MQVLCLTVMSLWLGIYKQKVSDVASVMLDAVCKFSEKNQTADLALIQIVIFDPTMCEGFARALQSAVKSSKSLIGRTKRKSAEVCGKVL